MAETSSRKEADVSEQSSSIDLSLNPMITGITRLKLFRKKVVQGTREDRTICGRVE